MLIAMDLFDFDLIRLHTMILIRTFVDSLCPSSLQSLVSWFEWNAVDAKTYAVNMESQLTSMQPAWLHSIKLN